MEVSWHVAPVSMTMAKLPSERSGRSLVWQQVREVLSTRGASPRAALGPWVPIPTAASRSCRSHGLGSHCLLGLVVAEEHLGLCACEESPWSQSPQCAGDASSSVTLCPHQPPAGLWPLRGPSPAKAVVSSEV